MLLNKDVRTENKLKELLTFSSKPANDDRKIKRIRVQTEKIKESKEQAEICSPKKKKKESSCASGNNESPKKSKEKKRKDESAAARKTEKKNQETVALCTEKEILSDLSSQFSLESELNKKSTEDGTSLTTTWRLCKPALQSEVIPETQSHVQQTVNAHIPPPQKVLQLFSLLLDPIVSGYMKKMVDQFGSQNIQECAPHHGHESVFLNLDSSEHSKGYDHNACSSTPLISLDQMPMSTMISEASSDKTYFDSSQSFEMPYSATPQQTVTLRRSPRKKINLPAMPVGDELSYDQPKQFTLSSDSPTTYLPRTPSRKTNISSSPGEFTSLTESPLPTTHLQMKNMVTPMEAQKNYSQMDHFTFPTNSPMATNTSTSSNFRTSPRKNPTSTSLNSRTSPRKMPFKSTLEVDISTEKNNLSKLLGNSNITIDKEVLAVAVRLAKKSAKPAYTLTMKLMPGLFTTEEMALSRGQGLLAKKGDLRPALDKDKVLVLKDYVRCWCKANGFSDPSDSLINEAITEKISYARKQLKRKLYSA